MAGGKDSFTSLAVGGPVFGVAVPVFHVFWTCVDMFLVGQPVFDLFLTCVDLFLVAPPVLTCFGRAWTCFFWEVITPELVRGAAGVGKLRLVRAKERAE